jgi:hypothetical protein
MMALEWVAIGLAALIAVSLVVGLVLGRILGTINDAASRLQDEEPRESVSMTRGTGPSVHDQRARRATRQTLGLQARD